MEKYSWTDKAIKMVNTIMMHDKKTIDEPNDHKISKITLQAFFDTPRHEFVPERQQEAAYNDTPLMIGSGQTISQPYIVALMTQLLNVKSGDKVLEIGTGSGYQAAI